jgi:peptide/nickel transport system substrate-binding protein
VIAVAALLLTVGAFAIPRTAVAQANGGYADSLIFSVVPLPQAVAAVSSGDQDMYIFSLDTGQDKINARDDPNINVKEAFSGFRGMLVNPVAPSSGDFNPFTIREIREAMHWAYDREFIINEIQGGFGIPMNVAQFSAEPEYVRDAAFFASIQIEYSYDPDRAKAQVDAAMSIVPGASFDTATNQWLMNGNLIDVIIIQRTEDTRFEVGAYVATEIANLGFNPVLDPSTFAEALNKVYDSDAKLGIWNMYTEGWGSSGFVQFDDTQTNFFYNGDFGSALWVDYSPPPALSIACQTLNDGNYATLDERRELQRTCTRLGMQDGIRSFLAADVDVYAYNTRLSNTAFDLFGGNLQVFAVRSTMKDGAPGGTLKIAQPIHTDSPWNAYGGFNDVYSVYQQYSLQDYGTWTHPHIGVVIPMRADFIINSVGPLAKHTVPTSAMTFDVATNTFVNVAAEVESSAFVEYNYMWGEWHHGEMMSMDDVVSFIAQLSRMAPGGDLGILNPSSASQTYLTRWGNSFRGFEIIDADNIRIYYDTFNPDESLIAGRADVFPWYPWELNQVMTESVLAGETAFSSTDAGLIGNVELDLAKGNTFLSFDPLLDAALTANTIPAYLTTWITPAEATARWAALDAWRNKPAGCTTGPSVWTCNYMVSNGPYVLTSYFTAPEGALYTAKRTGYPLTDNTWDVFNTIRVPTVALGTPPDVVQTFPATFQFTTSLNQQPYNLIKTAAWLVLDPATKNILFNGDAVRTGPGAWEIVLTAEQTTALTEGTYELSTIVVGDEAALPVTTTQSFTSLNLATAIIADLTLVLDAALEGFQTDIDAAVDAADAANSAAAAATSLANTVLILAIVAVVVAVVAIAFAVVWGRRGGAT